MALLAWVLEGSVSSCDGLSFRLVNLLCAEGTRQARLAQLAPTRPSPAGDTPRGTVKQYPPPGL